MRYLIQTLSILLTSSTIVAQPGPSLNDRAMLSTGYIAYQDNTSTGVTVSAGDTITLYLSPDGIEDRNQPLGIDSLYNRVDSTIIGRFGDAYVANYEIIVTQNTNSDTKISYCIDIGNGIPPLYKNGSDLNRGIGTITDVNKSTGIYTLDTWEANGGKLKITTDNEVEVIYKRLILFLIHKGHGTP